MHWNEVLLCWQLKNSLNQEIDFETKEKLLVNVLTEKEDADSILEAEVKTSTGNLHLKDYASAGKDKKKEIAVWLLTK